MDQHKQLQEMYDEIARIKVELAKTYTELQRMHGVIQHYLKMGRDDELANRSDGDGGGGVCDRA